MKGTSLLSKLKRTVASLAISLSLSTAVAQNPRNIVLSPVTLTDTNQTSSAIVLKSATANLTSSFSTGTISVTGSNLVTATFSVLGSPDGGNTYAALPINSISAPTVTSQAVTVNSSGIYQINLTGITNIEFQTSGTFTSTNLVFSLTASPNGMIARSGTPGPVGP